MVAAGLAATLAVGPAAFADEHTDGATATAVVESTITLTGATDFTLTGTPGDEVPAATTSQLSAKTNNQGGYNVTVLADEPVGEEPAGLLGGADGNTDLIEWSALKVQNSGDTYTELSTGTSVEVHTQAERSSEDGDALTASYELTMPFVNADTYSGGLTFTATAN